MAIGKRLEHQMPKVRIVVIALGVDIESVDVQQDILPADDLVAFIGPLGHIDDDHSARRSG